MYARNIKLFKTNIAIYLQLLLLAILWLKKTVSYRLDRTNNAIPIFTEEKTIK